MNDRGNPVGIRSDLGKLLEKVGAKLLIQELCEQWHRCSNFGGGIGQME
jgi:hypothetical protein